MFIHVFQSECFKNLNVFNKSVFFLCQSVKGWTIRASLSFLNVFQIRFLFEVVVSTASYMLCLLEIATCVSICLVDASLYKCDGKISS